mgnify:CR=1 FL=1
MGIADGNLSSDGVRFRVRVRDEQRELHTLFEVDYRDNLWSDLVEVSLADFEGQAIDLLLGTQGWRRFVYADARGFFDSGEVGSERLPWAPPRAVTAAAGEPGGRVWTVPMERAWPPIRTSPIRTGPFER